MKRVLCLTPILFVLMLSGCKTEDINLISIDRSELTFRDYKPEEQIVVVKSGVEWRANVVGFGVSEWLKIETIDDSKLKVSALNNITDKVRNGKVVVRFEDDADTILEISVIQDSRKDYRVSVESDKLYFVAKDAPVQELSIMTKIEDLTWSVEAEDSVLEWVDCVIKDNKIEISVKDNILTEMRFGYLKLVSDKTYINPIILTIKQHPPVSMSVVFPKEFVNGVLTVDGGVKLNAMIQIKSEGTNIDVRGVDKKGESILYPTGWLMVFQMPGVYSMQAAPYEKDIDRECTVTVVCLEDESKNVSFKIIQKALIKE